MRMKPILQYRSKHPRQFEKFLFHLLQVFMCSNKHSENGQGKSEWSVGVPFTIMKEVYKQVAELMVKHYGDICTEPLETEWKEGVWDDEEAKEFVLVGKEVTEDKQDNATRDNTQEAN